MVLALISICTTSTMPVVAGGSASVPCCGDPFTFGRRCWADTAYRSCFTLNRADILCHHVLLLSTCLPFVAMRSSVLPFFDFVIAHFSSSSLIYHSFFLTVAHLLLTFFFHYHSFIFTYDVMSFSCIVVNWFELDKTGSKASSRGSKGIKVELRARHAFLRLNTRAP